MSGHCIVIYVCELYVFFNNLMYKTKRLSTDGKEIIQSRSISCNKSRMQKVTFLLLCRLGKGDIQPEIES